MADLRGVALKKLNEARAAAEVEPESVTVPAMKAQAEANRKTLAAIWAVFDYVEAAELAGV